jgi:sugar/nucleoside kinase (ribokinase family)
MIRKVYGTGGIGSGILFKLPDDRPLTRDESRLALLTGYRDYCKAHIILHYVAALTVNVKVYAVGMVGRDEQGARLLREMREAKIGTRHVGVTAKARTLFAVCYQFPDGAGGNLTASNSACDWVTPKYIESCTGGIDSNSLVVTAPEVPLASRIRLLEIGRERGAFTVSSFLTGEAGAFQAAGGFALSDLVAVNRDEAEAAGGLDALARKNPAAKLIVTAGAEGSHLYEQGLWTHISSVPARVVSTAGAGDAYLAGTIAGLIGGKSFTESARYGAAAAKLAVESAHTIAETVTRDAVGRFTE